VEHRYDSGSDAVDGETTTAASVCRVQLLKPTTDVI